MNILSEAFLTFDDVLILPAYSEVLPSQVSTSTEIVRGVELKIPVISAAMDSVTEWYMAIEMARIGGCGVIHKNMPPNVQAGQVSGVKKQKVDERDRNSAALDSQGRFLVAAAVGPSQDVRERVEKLVEAKVDILFIDTAHGHSLGVIKTLREIKKLFSNVPVVVGNVATRDAVACLSDEGADAIKVGIGSGSICTTRIISGVGVPQLSAVIECAKEADRVGIPIIADGGIRHSGDVTKAIGAGASAVMLGSMLAGTREAPGHTIEIDGKLHKGYRGMGSISAMKMGSKDRYGQSAMSNDKLVPEGVEACVPYKGLVKDVVYQVVGGLRSGMGYTGHASVSSMRGNVKFVKITQNGVTESHVHGVLMTESSPNYRGR